MNEKNGLKLAFVDNRQWYSPNLSKSLNILCPTLVSYIYFPKNYKARRLPKETSFLDKKNMSTASNIWGTYSYPSDIFKKALSDRVNIVHIQWELNTFGNFYSSLLLPLLLLFLQISRVKCVITIHSVVPRSSFGSNLSGFNVHRSVKPFIESLFIALYKIIVLLSDAVIVHGESLRKLLCFDYSAKPAKVFVIPYGISSEAYSSNSFSKFDEVLPEDKDVILALGRISPRKGLDTLIKAFDKLSSENPSWTLVIAGGVPSYYEYYYSYLKKLASSLMEKNQVIFLGEFGTQDISRLMEAAKVVVFPYVYNFGASSTLTFALQHRKVVVISALNFVTDFFTDGKNALLTPPGNPESLAKAIERAIHDESLRHTIQNGVDVLLQRSSWDFVANETLKIYNQVLSGATKNR